MAFTTSRRGDDPHRARDGETRGTLTIAGTLPFIVHAVLPTLSVQPIRLRRRAGHRTP
ncbi:hypothetical protein [Streptomyces tritici]|uniref:hypothetical protein n=1 Tax=Streptomyces tritici TaxID=2054410 RepID=UPI003AEF7491